jgi:hypothetical protein
LQKKREPENILTALSHIGGLLVLLKVSFIVKLIHQKLFERKLKRDVAPLMLSSYDESERQHSDGKPPRNTLIQSNNSKTEEMEDEEMAETLLLLHNPKPKEKPFKAKHTFTFTAFLQLQRDIKTLFH